jgi:hypothetical protein
MADTTYLLRRPDGVPVDTTTDAEVADHYARREGRTVTAVARSGGT